MIETENQLEYDQGCLCATAPVEGDGEGKGKKERSKSGGGEVGEKKMGAKSPHFFWEKKPRSVCALPSRLPGNPSSFQVSYGLRGFSQTIL